jgi:hypothetical protein
MPEFAKSITAIDICLEKIVAGGERGTIVPSGSHTIADALVPHSWHKTVAALFECTGIFLLLSCYQDGKSIYRLVNPLLVKHPAAKGCTDDGTLAIVPTYKTHKKPLRIQQHPASASTATLKNSTWTGRGQASSTA